LLTVYSSLYSFVDRDMFTRFLGIGIGHRSQHPIGVEAVGSSDEDDQTPSIDNDESDGAEDTDHGSGNEEDEDDNMLEDEDDDADSEDDNFDDDDLGYDVL
jgi:hypothetical protein